MKSNAYEDLKKLTPEELLIYKAIKLDFPATSHVACVDYAVRGGVDFQLQNRH